MNQFPSQGIHQLNYSNSNAMQQQNLSQQTIQPNQVGGQLSYYGALPVQQSAHIGMQQQPVQLNYGSMTQSTFQPQLVQQVPTYMLPNVGSSLYPNPGVVQTMPVMPSYYNPPSLGSVNVPYQSSQQQYVRPGTGSVNPFRSGTSIIPAPPAGVPPKAQEAYHCDACDKDCPHKSAFEAHIAAHETCKHPGCNFSASKKVVSAHFHSSHGKYSDSGYKVIDVEGQKFNVLLGNSSDEIEEWKKERRKKFPTEENKQMKLVEKQRIIDAGGIVASECQFGEPSNMKKKGKKRSQPSVGEDNTAEDLSTKVAKNVNTDKKKRCVYFMKGKCANGDSCKYSHEAVTLDENAAAGLCRAFAAKGVCKRGSKCPYRHEEGGTTSTAGTTAAPAKSKTNTSAVTTTSDTAAKGKKKGSLYLPSPLDGKDCRGTLLRCLLSKEINNEENKILQCFRFLTSKQFFDPSDSADESTKASSDTRADTATAVLKDGL